MSGGVPWPDCQHVAAPPAEPLVSGVRGVGCVWLWRRGKLTAPGGLLAQLQPEDGQPAGSSTHQAWVAGAVHPALALRGLVGLNPVSAVALRAKLQPGVHITSERRKETRSEQFVGAK